MKTPSFFLSGSEFCESTSQRRHVTLSNKIAVALFGLAMISEIMYVKFYAFNSTAISILVIGFGVLLTILLNKWGLNQFSRALLCISPMVALIAASIYSKFYNTLLVREYDYFTYRIILLALAVLPVVLFTNRELRYMTGCLIISGLLLLLFDPIHVAFGAGNQTGGSAAGRYYFFANVVFMVAYTVIIGSVMILKSAAERNELFNENVIRETESTKQNLLRYQNAILTLAKDFRAMAGTEAELSKRLCEVLADNLRVSRVSVWNLSEQNTILTRVHLHEDNATSDEHVALKRSDFPSYFNALETQPFIMATNAQTHSDTKEFTESYLRPLQIYSMLDCPIVVENQVAGVICCENQQEPRDWKPEDTLFMQSLSDLISVYRQNEEIRKLYQTVQHKNNELVNKTNEIKSINDNLETLVRNRTLELEERNQKLVEYGFINSHLLRAPLTRILGLSDLISREVTLQEKQMLLHLLDSARELDKVVSRINDTLNENQFITKEDVISGTDKPA
jgi:GAF domain-containing protein